MPEIQMPKLSDTMTEGTLVSWKKKIGDKVTAGEVLAEIETDKATMEWEATDDGVLKKIYVPGRRESERRRSHRLHWRRRGRSAGRVGKDEEAGGEERPSARKPKSQRQRHAKKKAKPAEADVSTAKTTEAKETELRATGGSARLKRLRSRAKSRRKKTLT